MPRRKSKRKAGTAADDLMKLLVGHMEACSDAERLNDEVIIPFAAALETVAGARGYLLNIYGETSNIVFTGDPEDAEAIYGLIERYLDEKGDML